MMFEEVKQKHKVDLDSNIDEFQPSELRKIYKVSFYPKG